MDLTLTTGGHSVAIGSLLWRSVPPMMAGGGSPCDCGPPDQLFAFPPPPPTPPSGLFASMDLLNDGGEAGQFEVFKEQCERDLSVFGIDSCAGEVSRPLGGGDIGFLRQYLIFAVTAVIVISVVSLLAVILLLWLQRKCNFRGSIFDKPPAGMTRQSNSSSSNGSSAAVEHAIDPLRREQEGKTLWSYNSMRPMQAGRSHQSDNQLCHNVGAMMYGGESPHTLQYHQATLGNNGHPPASAVRLPSSCTMPKKRLYLPGGGIPSAISVPAHLQLPPAHQPTPPNNSHFDPRLLHIGTDDAHHYCSATPVPANGNGSGHYVYEEIPAAVARLYEVNLAAAAAQQQRRRPPPHDRPPPPPPPRNAATAVTPTSSASCSCSCSPTTSLNSTDGELQALADDQPGTPPSPKHRRRPAHPATTVPQNCSCCHGVSSSSNQHLPQQQSNGRESGYGTEGRSGGQHTWNSPQLKAHLAAALPPAAKCKQTAHASDKNARASGPQKAAVDAAQKGSGASLTIYGHNNGSQHSMTYV